jgi:hypothetical protein
LEDGNGEIWMCLYFPKPFVPSLAELAVFKFVPHPYCQQSWKTPLFAVKWPFAGLFLALIYNHEIKADIQYYY